MSLCTTAFSWPAVLEADNASAAHHASLVAQAPVGAGRPLWCHSKTAFSAQHLLYGLRCPKQSPARQG